MFMKKLKKKKGKKLIQIMIFLCRGEGLGNLLVLREILITYAAFHPGKSPQAYWHLFFQKKVGFVRVKKQSLCAPFDSEVSYAQGMNDLCSRFLEVLDSEVDTFWSFSCYMEKFSKDFRADGLHRKIGEGTENRYKLAFQWPLVVKIRNNTISTRLQHLYNNTCL